jgi:hypothetical protein
VSGGRGFVVGGGRGIYASGGYYPGLYGYSWPYYSNYGYYPSYDSSYYPDYCPPLYGYGYPLIPYGYNAGVTVPPQMPPVTLNVAPLPSASRPAIQTPEAPEPGTFQYDGGPTVPVPMPPTDQPAQPQTRGPHLADDIVISTTPGPGKWHYPAYGERAARTVAPPTRTLQRAVIVGLTD